MNQPVFRGVSQSLVHSPDLLYSYGSVPVLERAAHPQSDYVRRLPIHLRTYESALNYQPFQAYVGNANPCELPQADAPIAVAGGERWGPYGEIMPEPEFLALLKLVDQEEAVRLEERFAVDEGYRMADHPLFAGRRFGSGYPAAELLAMVSAGLAMPLYSGAQVAAVVLGDLGTLEALVVQAAAELAYRHLASRAGLGPQDSMLKLTCTDSEFPSALLQAAGLVERGEQKHVAIVVVTPLASLGSHSPQEVAANRPVLEDVISAYAVHIGEDDGASPQIRLNAGSGSARQLKWPLLSTLREQLLSGEMARWDICGSDGRSAVLERNSGLHTPAKRPSRVGITTFGLESGAEELVGGAELAQAQRPDLQVVLLGDPGIPTALEVAACTVIGPAHREMERRLQAQDLQAAVTTRYSFPPESVFVGRVAVPGRGKPALLVRVPCQSAAERVESLVRGAVVGAAMARTLGTERPGIDLLSLPDGKRSEQIIRELQSSGWNVETGCGAEAPDVMVTERCEPMEHSEAGVGEGQRLLVCAILPSATASGIAEAIGLAGDLACGGLVDKVAAELAQARAAGLEQLLARPLTV